MFVKGCVYIIVKSAVDNTHSWEVSILFVKGCVYSEVGYGQHRAVQLLYFCQRLCIYSEVGCGQHTQLGS